LPARHTLRPGRVGRPLNHLGEHRIAMKKDGDPTFVLGRRHVPEQVVWLALAIVWLSFFTFRFAAIFTNDNVQVIGGTLATGLLDGLASPPGYYQDEHTTGCLLFGVLLLPVYWAFGSSLLWIKLLSAFFVVAGIFCWIIAVRRAWGRPAALVFYLWTLFPPPYLEWNYHQSWASHVESYLFSGLLLLWFARAGASPPRRRETFAYSLLAGLAAAFAQENLLIVAALATTSVWRWRRPEVRRLLVPAAIGFLVTFSLSLISPQMPIAHNRFAEVARHWLVDGWREWRELFVAILPHCASYRGLAGDYLSGAWFFLAVLGAIAVARDSAAENTGQSSKAWLSRVLLLQVFFFIAAYGLGAYRIRSAPFTDFHELRYLVPISLTLLAFLSYLVWRVGSRWKWAFLAGFLIAGFINVTSDVDFTVDALRQGIHRFRIERGDDYYGYIAKNAVPFWSGNGQALAYVAALPRRWRGEGFVQVGAWMGPSGFLALASGDRTLDEDARRNLARGAGVAIASADRPGSSPTAASLGDSPNTAVAGLRDLSAEIATSLAAGVGQGMFFEDARLGGGVVDRSPLSEPIEKETLARRRRAECTAKIHFVEQLLPQLSENDLIVAAIGGMGYTDGRGLGSGFELDYDLTQDRINDILSIWEDVLPGEQREAAGRALRQGFAEGFADRLKNDFNRYTFRSRAVGVAMIRDALLKQGIRLQEAGPRSSEFKLEILE
jgi:hypothetical protein